MDNQVKDILENSPKLVIGLSGGVDSILLFHRLLSLYKNKLVVAHVNHGFRNESEEEYNFVENLCKDSEVKFYGTKLDVLQYKKDNNISSDEKAARDLRYEFYEEVLKKENTDVLVLGHHGDDLVEGVLMRLVSGASGKGLISMTKLNLIKEGLLVVRPLLYMSKSDIYNEANNLGLEWREDSSNTENKYTRNRYRNNILPLLKEENEKVHSNFLRYSELKKEEESYFDSIVNDRLDKNIINNNGIYTINKDFWLKENVVIKRRLLLKIVKDLGLDYANVLLLEILDEKIKNNYNTDYNELLKGVYVVNSSINFYLVSSNKRAELSNDIRNIKAVGNNLINDKKLFKLQKDKKVPVAFREFIQLEGYLVKDMLGNLLCKLDV